MVQIQAERMWVSPLVSFSQLNWHVICWGKRDGTEFPPNTLHHLVCGIQRHIRFNEKKAAIDDEEFADCEGRGLSSRLAEPITEEEELLWEKGLLGKHSPQSLLDTMVFMNGVYFALRSGKEHRQLRAEPCQIVIHERPGGGSISWIQRRYLQEGLKWRKNKPKVVQHYSNTSNADRCFVTLFKLYQSLCPSDRPEKAFYLQPLQRPNGSCWFSKQALGHNKLEATMARLWKAAGIEGFRSVHHVFKKNKSQTFYSARKSKLCHTIRANR